MFSRPLEKARGERADPRRQGVVGFLSPGPLRLIPEKDRRVVAEALGDGLNRNVLIEEGGGMDATKIMGSRLAAPVYGLQEVHHFGWSLYQCGRGADGCRHGNCCPVDQRFRPRVLDKRYTGCVLTDAGERRTQYLAGTADLSRSDLP